MQKIFPSNTIGPEDRNEWESSGGRWKETGYNQEEKEGSAPWSLCAPSAAATVLSVLFSIASEPEEKNYASKTRYQYENRSTNE